MTPRELDENMSVTPQIQVSDIETIAKLGFKTIIANRPDQEEFGQPAMEEIEAAAKAAGLDFIYQPVISGQFSQHDLDSFTNNYNNAAKPLLGFCRTGTRCTILWGLSNVGNYDVETRIAKAADAGYDLSGLRS